MSDEGSEMSDDTPRSHVWRWIIGVIAALAIVALLAYHAPRSRLRRSRR